MTMSEHSLTADRLKVEKIYNRIQSKYSSLSFYLQMLDFYTEDMEKAIYEQSENKIEADVEWENFKKNDFPYLINAFIMVLMSAFEDSSNEICEGISLIKKIPLGRNDISGGLIKSFRKFLDTFSNFVRPDDEKWSTVEAIYQVRNILIHGGGDINKSNIGSMKKIKYLADKKVGLFLTHDNRIILTMDFCQFALKSIENFFEELRTEHSNLLKGLRIIK